jgi:hypothetical protein
MTTMLSSPGSAQPLVRIRRAPALEPPADDDRRADDHPVCAGQLALFTSIHGVRARAGHPGTASAQRPGARPPIKPADPSAAAVGSATTVTGPTGPHPAAPVTGNPSASAPAQAAASRFVAVCVEVLNGFRPVGHLRALTTPVEFTGVTTQLTRRAVRVRMPSRDPAGQERVSVRRLRVFEQRTGAADAVVVLRHGESSWAMALRFEHRRGSWLCTLLQVI